MRRLALGMTSLVAAAGITAVALAQTPQTTISGSAKVTPNKAGTKAHPQGVKLTVHVAWNTPGDGEKPVVQRAITYFPKGSLYNGGKYPSCSEDVLNRKGPAGCPKHSIMGKGYGDAWADTVITHPDITIVNGGAHEVFLYTILNNPARVQAPVPGIITKQSGKWAYKMEITVPQKLQVVAGVPIALKDLTFKTGYKDWLATTGCTGGKWPFSVQTFYDNGTNSSFTSSTPCKK